MKNLFNSFVVPSFVVLSFLVPPLSFHFVVQFFCRLLFHYFFLLAFYVHFRKRLVEILFSNRIFMFQDQAINQLLFSYFVFCTTIWVNQSISCSTLGLDRTGSPQHFVTQRDVVLAQASCLYNLLYKQQHHVDTNFCTNNTSVIKLPIATSQPRKSTVNFVLWNNMRPFL